VSEVEETPAGVPDLRLRGDPPRVMRLSRKALAILGLVGGTAIGGALLYALQPVHKAAPEELYEAQSHATPDTLAGAPKDYSQVPKLGPPLPGDLGRPIVAAQARGVDVNPPPIGVAGPPRPAGGATAVDAVRQRVRQERDSARISKLFLASAAPGGSTGGGPYGTAVAPGPVGAAATPMTTSSPAAGADDDQAHKRAFMTSEPQRHTVSAERLVAVPSPYTLLAGSVIQAALITGVRSDLPGQITAQVTANVYDSATGHLLLIQQGARLIGEYDSSISFGQNRVLLAWSRLILPDGRSLVLEREPGTDAGGFAGLQDGVNYHWGGIGRAALLSTLLGVGAQVGGNGDDELLRAVRQGTSDTINQAGQQIVRRQLNVQPTLTIRPGYPVRVIVTHDLVLAPADGGQ
jgi:type IV secretory pathway VirB10-like protein